MVSIRPVSCARSDMSAGTTSVCSRPAAEASPAAKAGGSNFTVCMLSCCRLAWLQVAARRVSSRSWSSRTPACTSCAVPTWAGSVLCLPPQRAALGTAFGLQPGRAPRAITTDLFNFLTVAYRIHCVDGGAQISQPCVWSAGSTGSRDRLPLPGVPVKGRPMNGFSYHGDDGSPRRAGLPE